MTEVLQVTESIIPLPTDIVRKEEFQSMNIPYSGQLPTGKNSPADKNYCPPGPQSIGQLTTMQDNSPPGPLSLALPEGGGGGAVGQLPPPPPPPIMLFRSFVGTCHLYRQSI